MKLFDNRLVLSFMLGIGSIGLAGLIEVIILGLAHHRAFPIALVMGGVQWGWCTVWAGQRLFRERPPEPARIQARPL